MLLAGAIIVTIMYFAGDVLVPLALAALLSFVLAGPVRALQRFGLPRPVAVVAVVVLAYAAIFELGQMLALELGNLAGDLPKYETAIQTKVEALQGPAARGAGSLEQATGVLRDLDRQIAASRQKPGDTPPVSGSFPGDLRATVGAGQGFYGLPMQSLVALVSPVLTPLVSASLAFIFVVFILIQHEDLRNRLVRLAGATDIPHTTATLDEVGRRLSRLFLVQLVINSCYGAAIILGLAAIGVPGAAVWGVLSGILRFVPFVGPVLGSILPLVLSFAVGPGWSATLWTAALYAGLESVTGQVVEPLFEGRATGVTPLAIVVAAIFWAWIWGSIGLVMSTPLTVILVALGRHFEALKVFDILFGDAPVLTEPEALYQRLLGRNAVGAIGDVKRFVSSRSLSAYCDEVVRPALDLARRDLERGALGGGALTAFVATHQTLFAEVARSRWVRKRAATLAAGGRAGALPLLSPGKPGAASASPANFVAIGARDALDDAGSLAIATLAETHGLHARIAAPNALTNPDRAALDMSGAALVCLSFAGPATAAEAGEAVRQVRERAPHAKIMLGLWCAPDEATVETLRTASGADFAFRSFHYAATALLEDAIRRAWRRHSHVCVSERPADESSPAAP